MMDERKKNTEIKILQMKKNAIRDIKNASIMMIRETL